MTRRMILIVVAVASFFFLNNENALTNLAESKNRSSFYLLGISLAAQDAFRIKLKSRQIFEGYYQGYFSPDGTLLALLYRDHIDMVEISSERRLYRLIRPQSKFHSVAFAPDGRTFATMSIEDGQENDFDKLVLWETTTGREIRTFVRDTSGLNAVHNLSFSKDGLWLVSHAGRIARLFEVETGREVRQFLPPSDPAGLKPSASLISPDGKWVVVNFRRFIPPLLYDVVKAWELETGREVTLDTNVSDDWRFSADSSLLAISIKADKGKVTERNVVEFWEVGSWNRKRAMEVPSGWVGAFTIDLSPTNEFAVIGGYKMFGIFSMETGVLLGEKRHPTGEADYDLYYDLTWAEFSPDGKTLLTAGNDGYVRLWKIKRVQL